MTYLVPARRGSATGRLLLASDPPDATEPLVWAYLRRSSGETTWRFYETARQQKRLLLLLDGFVKEGAFGIRLEREIGEFSTHGPSSGGDVAGHEVFARSTFQRFDGVRGAAVRSESVKAIAKQKAE